MAIDVTYGPISAALGLANLSGKAQAKRFNVQQDMDFTNLMSQRQQHADALYAQQVQQALGVQEFNSNQQMQQNQQGIENNRIAAQQAMANKEFNFNVANANRTADYHHQALSQANDLGQQRIDIQGQRADTGTDRFNLAAQREQARQASIGRLAPELQDIVQSTGRMPYIPNNLGANAGDQDTKTLQAEYRRLQAAATQEVRNQSNFMVDGKSRLGTTDDAELSKQSVAAGFEKQFRDSTARLQQIKARQTQIEQGLTSHVNGLLDPNHPQQNNIGSKVLEYLRGLNGKGGGQPQTGVQDQQQGQETTLQKAPNGLPMVNDQNDYIQLPSGSKYVYAGNGQTYLKK